MILMILLFDLIVLIYTIIEEDAIKGSDYRETDDLSHQEKEIA